MRPEEIYETFEGINKDNRAGASYYVTGLIKPSLLSFSGFNEHFAGYLGSYNIELVHTKKVCKFSGEMPEENFKKTLKGFFEVDSKKIPIKRLLELKIKQS